MTDWQYSVPGIPDSHFIRGDVPMTKEEVRSLTISKLRLKEDTKLYDIGAGTGSISIEAALFAGQGWIYAVERSREGRELIKQNADRFQTDNLEIIAGEAPAAIEELPAADRIFIGGSGGRLEEILEVCRFRLKNKGRIVINAVTVETLTAADKKLNQLDFQVEITGIAVTRTRKAGDYRLFDSLNQVYIITGERY